MKRSKLTPTSYVLLGLLARRPWTAYELTKYMKLSALRRVWPRAESRLYAEPKKLAEQGLVRSEEQINGGRKRTLYHITDTGRAVLAEWYRSPTAEWEYEYETLVKLLNGDHAEEQLAALVEESRQQAITEAEALIEGCQTILDEGWRIPQTAEHNAIVIRFIRRAIEARMRWIDDAEQMLARRRARETSPQNEHALAREWYQEEIKTLKTLLSQQRSI